MTGDIRRLLARQPFVPFTIHLADGGELRVPTVDHMAVWPSGKRMMFIDDQDNWTILSPLMISRITVEGDPASEPARQ